ncbi:MAG: preprotein translocase subunit SecE [Actinomycetota bacterium]
MRRLMEREERLQKRDQGSGPQRRSPIGQPKGPGAPERRPLWSRLATFLHEVRQELKKVNWPSREQMAAFTVITLITTVALTLVIFGLDVVMKEAVITLLDRS